MNSLQDLLLDLFQEMRNPRSAAMRLTIEQFDLLCQAVEESDELKDWEQLRRLCRLVWVKPHDDYDSERFEQTFDAYRDQCQDRVSALLNTLQVEPEPKNSERKVSDSIQLGQLPTLPPRIFSKKGHSTVTDPEEDSDTPKDLLTGVKVDGQDDSPFVLRQLPLSLDDIKQTWRALSRPLPSDHEMELDTAATLRLIERDGLFWDVVQRPVMRRKGELVLWVDDDNPMIPFRPAIEPLIQVATDHCLGEVATIYRFTTYPVQYVYPWEHPTQATTVSSVLSRLHSQRSVAMIVSDAGAASRTYNSRRIRQTGAFLERLRPCVREVIWVNPLPESRWHNTSAAVIANGLGGRMVPMEVAPLKRVAQGQEIDEGMRLWSLTP